MKSLIFATACSAISPIVTASESSEASVRVLASSSARPIQKGFIGFSCEKSAVGVPISDRSNTSFVALFKCIEPGVLRIADVNFKSRHWNPPCPGGGKAEVSPRNVARLAVFIEACDSKVIYGTGLADITNERAAAEAAEAARPAIELNFTTP